ncbi:MAG TPA: phage tail sheath C-terminal domain-containing protein [Allosphingosinicella sp.]|jgi:hypothetical protein
MHTVQTPGVYINDADGFQSSIVGVETAVPAFVGYTEKASCAGKPTTNAALRIESMAEFEACFGGPPAGLYFLSAEAPGAGETAVAELRFGAESYWLARRGRARFSLYDCVRHFYANGGASAYIVSCASYGGGGPAYPLDADLLMGGLAALEREPAPAMLVVPEAAWLDAGGYAAAVGAMLDQCARLQDRVALIDVRGGDDPDFDFDGHPNAIDAFRATIAALPGGRDYGAAYFPFLVTDMVRPEEIGMSAFDPARLDTLKAALTAAADASPTGAAAAAEWIEAIGTSQPNPAPGAPPLPAGTLDDSRLRNALVAAVPEMGQVLAAMAEARNSLPPSAAVAGAYAQTDISIGPWKAPDRSLASVVEPVVRIDDRNLEGMNVDADGLAINAIRSFVDRGAQVWGARTLDGNSQDWRYLSVRRTAIYIEQSIKEGLRMFVFAPNAAETWAAAVSAVQRFLHDLWAAGGLQGATPDDAYSVAGGLGTTMTGQDVIDGVMRVTVHVAMLHPAEFIALTVSQQQQLSEA